MTLLRRYVHKTIFREPSVHNYKETPYVDTSLNDIHVQMEKFYYDFRKG